MLVEQIDQEGEFLRALVFSEEERAKWTASPWHGEFRWFLSPNIILID